MLLVATVAVLVSGYVHFYLYFEGGYRGIHPQSVLGLTISRAFILNAVAAVIIAEALVAATCWAKWILPAAAAGIVFAVSALAAYTLTRTAGFLGFSDTQHPTAAAIAVTTEAITVVSLAAVIAAELYLRGEQRPQSRHAGSRA